MSEINDIEEIPEFTFTIYIKLIQEHQREEPSITDKYKYGTYHTVSFRGGSNIDLKIITCKDKIVILSIIQIYVVHYYHTYILHPGIYRTEVTIRQHLYWPNIRYYVRK